MVRKVSRVFMTMPGRRPVHHEGGDHRANHPRLQDHLQEEAQGGNTDRIILGNDASSIFSLMWVQLGVS